MALSVGRRNGSVPFLFALLGVSVGVIDGEDLFMMMLVLMGAGKGAVLRMWDVAAYAIWSGLESLGGRI